jgi:glycosyltransferase involved in cell wall biosynthesis
MNNLNFHIITPFKGKSKFLDQCIRSVKMQTLPSIHHVIIDTDNKGACRNHFEALQKINPEKNNIVVHLDGDDVLISDNVLEILSEAYQDDNIWATYGSFVSKNGSGCQSSVRDWISYGSSFREFWRDRGGWPWSHLRTFRAHLIPHVKEEDMKDSSGNWFSSAGDVAVFLPILELSSKQRVKYISEDLVYYRIHDNNDHADQFKLREQFRCSQEILNKKEYKKL